MKEAQRWQTGIELSLDRRQIFLLFFASAVIISLVFSLGVVVGKRLDRGVTKTTSTDPLALLDQMGGDNPEDELTFQDALTSKEKHKNVEPSKEANKAQGIVSGAKNNSPALDATESLPKVKNRANSSASNKSVLNGNDVTVKPLAQVSVKAHKEQIANKIEPLKETTVKLQNSVSSRTAPSEKVSKTNEAAGSYSLQLSSFQDRQEAEMFMKKLRESGMKPYMMPANIPGRGVWFRVRLGRFKSWEEALSAKEEFEKKQKMIAYVFKN